MVASKKPIVCLCLLASWLVATAMAQSAGDRFRQLEPELAGLFDAAYVAQARMFAEIAAIDGSPETQAARDAFERRLRMRASMSMAEMMAMMRQSASAMMPGPFDEQESAFGEQMLQMLQARYSSSVVDRAHDRSPLPDRVVDVIRSGRRFENGIYEILADNSVDDKPAALADAVAAYVAEDSSVPAQPKPASLLLEHPRAGAFADGYPKLSRLLWSTQWLQLATIESMLLESRDSQYWGTVDTVRERFLQKISDSGGNGSPLPVELPMAPAIAPTLFSASPEAAIVLDNLNMFETVVADLLSYPNLANRSGLLLELTAQFTDHGDSFDTTVDYLVSALRGGIYNQGGPAIGDLAQSERNRSRMEMGMQHTMVMSNP